VLADGNGLAGVAGQGAPELDQEVGGGGDQGGVLLGEGYVVDPVGVRLCLGTEAGDGLGAAVWLLWCVVRGGCMVQVPGADDTVPAAGVAVVIMSELELAGDKGGQGVDSQEGIVAVDGQAIDTEAVATRGGIGELKD